MSSALTHAPSPPRYETITDDHDRRVALTKFDTGLTVSTVELNDMAIVMDELLEAFSAAAGRTSPGLEAADPKTHRFELMVFPKYEAGHLFENYCERFQTREEAQAGHERVVQSIVDGTFRPAGAKFDA